MYLVAIGWIYVVFMMSITENSVVAGVATFIFYGLIPVSIILYLGGSRRRRIRRQMEEDARRNTKSSPEEKRIDFQERQESDPPSS
ncbi:hypothetical protein Q8A64_09400 [Oxalobacteraceae bacterium R-40]|uniref:Transmembrane protein n=1 Tax=Keguizhuia sedimenti TaxID=3064264 RepID=A0ABU1BP33_9BURK|nr:hypothetical protein [Oxalobacteraceae bacterium R-40]